jgi:prephenate dehydratase
MAAKRITYFKAKVEDKPGALLALLKNLKAKNISLVSLKGVAKGEQGGDILAIAKNSDELRKEWIASAVVIEEGTAFFLSGQDKTGALLTSLEALANSGVNIVATEAVAVGGRYGAILWVTPVDLEKTAQALGAK